MKIKYGIKIGIKITSFLIIFLMLLNFCMSVFTVNVCNRTYNSVKDFYKEKKNSVDAVYIGSSNALAYWNAMLAWEEYGIVVPNFACNGMPVPCMQYFLEEAHRAQPDAVYVMNLNTLGNENIPNEYKHQRIFMYAPFSINKVEGIFRFNDFFDVGKSNLAEYFAPVIRFHSNWNNVTEKDFQLESNGFRGSDVEDYYLLNRKDYTKKYKMHDEFTELDNDLENSVHNLLDYCDEEKLKVLFVTVPQARTKNLVGKYNSVNKIISDRGYDTLNLLNDEKIHKEMNFDVSKDFYNNNHTNVYGSRKVTYYISEYLIEKYGFENKRDNENYSDWNDSLDEYMKIAYTALPEFATDRNYDPSVLSYPSGLKVAETDEGISVNWNEVEGADGYTVYERLGVNEQWKKIGETEKCSLTDKEYKSKTEYYYRVAPFRNDKNKKVYGDFSYKGVNLIMS